MTVIILQQVVLNIRMKRRPLYYLVNLVLPCVLLLCVGLMAFCLSADSGKKIELTTTILLTMMLFQIMVADKLPPTADHIPIVSKLSMLLKTIYCYGEITNRYRNTRLQFKLLLCCVLCFHSFIHSFIHTFCLILIS